MVRLVAIVAALILPASVSAAVGRVTATSGPWRAAFTFTHTGNGPTSYSGLHLTALKTGTLVLDTPVTSHLQGARYLQPGGFGKEKTLAFRDLDGDGVPELLLSLFTGGAHCCFIEQIYDLSGPAPRKSELSFADAGARIVRAGGRTMFQTADESFAYAFTDFAHSGAPIRLWAYSHGRFANVTRKFPALVRRDALLWWNAYRQGRRTHDDVRGVLASWAADQAILGRSADAKRTLLQIASTGALDRGFGQPKGSRYVRKLWVFLREEGYLR